MKKLIGWVLCAALLASANVFGAELAKKPKKTKSLENESVRTVELETQGIEVVECLSDDGTELIKRPYIWYAGTGTADNKQVALELAQREAYATLSRTLNNAVMDSAERATASLNEKTKIALKSHWEQVSSSLLKGCTPFGNAKVEYNPKTGIYTVTAKIGIRGDQYNKLLKSAGSFEPQDLEKSELEQFLQANQAIIDAVKPN